jgi:hypothetical protein
VRGQLQEGDRLVPTENRFQVVGDFGQRGRVFGVVRFDSVDELFEEEILRLQKAAVAVQF